MWLNFVILFYYISVSIELFGYNMVYRDVENFYF